MLAKCYLPVGTAVDNCHSLNGRRCSHAVAIGTGERSHEDVGAPVAVAFKMWGSISRPDKAAIVRAIKTLHEVIVKRATTGGILDSLYLPAMAPTNTGYHRGDFVPLEKLSDAK